MHEAAVIAADLARRIGQGDARVGISGQGYVGLPLAAEFARLGFAVTAFDTSLDRVTTLNAGRSQTPDVPDEALRARLESARGRAREALRERLPQREHRDRQGARGDVPASRREDGAPSSRPVAGRSHA